jgi:hypothetical protein
MPLDLDEVGELVSAIARDRQLDEEGGLGVRIPTAAVAVAAVALSSTAYAVRLSPRLIRAG